MGEQARSVKQCERWSESRRGIARFELKSSNVTDGALLVMYAHSVDGTPWTASASLFNACPGRHRRIALNGCIAYFRFVARACDAAASHVQKRISFPLPNVFYLSFFEDPLPRPFFHLRVVTSAPNRSLVELLSPTDHTVVFGSFVTTEEELRPYLSKKTQINSQSLSSQFKNFAIKLNQT